MIRSTALVASSLLLFSVPAQAGPLDAGQFAGSVRVGQEYSTEGDLHGGATVPVASLAALNPNLPAANAELRIGSRSYDDVYGEMLAVELEGAYGLGEGRELFFALRNTTADESEIQVGTAFVPALNAELPVFGEFGEYSALSIEAGARQYFGDGAFTPYIGARGGIIMVDEINATFTVPVPAGVGSEPNDIVLSNVPFYGETTTWTIGLDAGFSYNVSETFSLGAATGLRYQAELDGDDSAIGGLGLSSINEDSGRWSVPVTVNARLAF
jgi:hypothetical protein